MRPSSGHSLKGGVSRAARAWPRKPPKRPSDSTRKVVHRPRPSNGRSAGATGCSVMHGERGPACAQRAIDAERPEREVGGVQVVLEVEDPRKAGAVPEWIVPAAV